jgi:broad specificity phosphatase PhoE
MPGKSATERLKSVVIAVLFLLLLPALVFLYLLAWQTETTILLVRHAECAAGEPAAGECPPPGLGEAVRDSYGPTVTAEGKARAEALAHAASEANVSAVYVSEYCRSQWTAKPFLDRTAGAVAARQFAASDVRGLLRDILTEHRGGTVLVSSHSDRIPQIVSALGARQPPQLADGDYDDLFVITVYRFGAPRVLRLKYGRET